MAFQHGRLVAAQNQAENARNELAGRNGPWAVRFQMLEAEILIWRGLNGEALPLLDFQSPSDPDDAVRRDLLLGVAYARLGRWTESGKSLGEAQRLCNSNCELNGEVLRAEGVVAVQRGELSAARRNFLASLAIARRHGDQFLETTALSNLSVVAMREEHYDESIDWTSAQQNLAHAIDSKLQEEKALGNLGWDYYKMGDFDKALSLYQQAEKLAVDLDVEADKLLWLSNIGDTYVDLGRLSEAADSYKLALAAQRQTDNAERISVLANSLGLIALRNRDLEQAAAYSRQAIDAAKTAHVRLDELYGLFTEAEVDAASSKAAEAEQKLVAISRDSGSDAALRWAAEDGLAHLSERKNAFHDAEVHYRKALSILEAARSSLHGTEHRLPFLNNANQLYDNYIEFLLRQGKVVAALQLADYGRAQTLAEGLGLPQKKEQMSLNPSMPVETAREVSGVILFYRLGEERSHLWVVRPDGIHQFPLPSASKINALVRKYRNAILEVRDVLETGNADGVELYRVLIEPAQHFVPSGARVFVIPDGSLNDLNFETLLVPEPAPHFWIDDVSVADAYSMRLLGAHLARSKISPHSILLVGNPALADPAYPELQNASVEMGDIAKHFRPAELRVVSRDQATPVAYFQNQPQQFDYIHFVAHGTASRTDPLDSAIVLARASPQDESFKLYAREILGHPLQASLVTISTCYGAGTRTYSGEGLVGLAWAFLEAGARNVIGALWPVSDDSTPALMDQLYATLKKGSEPSVALRAAKLSLLHSQGVFRKPFYWAPLQLYVGPQPRPNKNSKLQ